MGGDVVRWLWIVIGALVTLTGVVWTLQGVGLLGGSAMTGERIWAVVGPIVALVGLALIWLGSRRRV